MLVLAQESNGLIVVKIFLVKPCLGPDAGVGEVLVRIRGEESKEGHLYHARCLVSDLHYEGRKILVLAQELSRDCPNTSATEERI